MSAALGLTDDSTELDECPAADLLYRSGGTIRMVRWLRSNPNRYVHSALGVGRAARSRICAAPHKVNACGERAIGREGPRTVE